MKLQFKGILSSYAAYALLLGCALNFHAQAFAQAQDSEHEQHALQDPKLHQNKMGPLDPLQKALEKNSSTPMKKTQVSNSAAPAMPQDSMKDSTSMKPAASGGMGGGDMMGMMSQMMGMMMPKMAAPQGGPTDATTSSELPGFPGASHIYHIGATGFFIDHASMTNFTKAQLISLNHLKEKALFAQSSLDRKIQKADEELWRLTASDQPVIKNITIKVKEIEAFKSEKRIAFIRAVGEAANVLTTQQRSVLLGTSPSKATDGAKPMSNM